MSGYTHALVTGASSGLGRGLSTYFAKKGVKVFAAARRLENLQALRAEVGDNIVPVQLDVADADATEAKVRELDESCGGLDLVIANAGVGVDSYGKRIKWQPLSQMLKVNVLGATATLCGALPGMVQRGKGQLVGISSVAAFAGMPKLGAYCGTKAYLATFLQGLRQDVTKLGLTVTCIHPGYVKSDMTAGKKNMPFLMETDDAVELMGKAIERRAAIYAFPWQLSLGMRTLATLPRPLFEVAAKRMG